MVFDCEQCELCVQNFKYKGLSIKKNVNSVHNVHILQAKNKAVF